jgi:diguanylate cyclase (GGDEF)-like protein
VDDYLEVFSTIKLNDKPIGKLYIRSDTDEINERMIRHLTTSLPISFISLLFAFVLTARLQKQIYEPIVQLGNVAHMIRENDSYSFRAEAVNDDELGETVEAFNRMLAKIEADQEELVTLAFYDPLTGLPNRRKFVDSLEFAISNSRRGHDKMALLFLDLDRFKLINDTMGHDIGDLLLKEVGLRLSEAVPEGGTAFRLSGDEFTVIIPTMEDEIEAERVAMAIIERFGEETILAGNSINISCSIGVAFSKGIDTVSTILKNADTALYRAKDAGRNNYKVYNRK